MQEKHGIVGIDAGKRHMEVVRLFSDRREIERGNFPTNAVGRSRLGKWLKAADTVFIEASTGAFMLVKEIQRLVGCECVVLNPGELAIIYRSLKKTDKEDALKIARLGQRIPREELPVVPLPTDEEEDQRRLVSENTFVTGERVALINRLHSLFHQAGFTDLTKKDLKTRESREKKATSLDVRYAAEAKRLMDRIDKAEEDLVAIQTESLGILKQHLALVTIYMSLTGIGPMNSLAILAHLGNFDRFSKAKQVSNFVGLTPKVDQSGDRNVMGETSKCGCKQIRRLIVQGAWSVSRSVNGGRLKDKFERIAVRRGKHVAIIAVAREMMELLFYMVKRNELYRGMTEAQLQRKMGAYGLR